MRAAASKAAADARAARLAAREKYRDEVIFKQGLRLERPVGSLRARRAERGEPSSVGLDVSEYRSHSALGMSYP